MTLVSSRPRTDGLDLVDVEALDDRVEARVDVVEEADDLEGRALAAQRREGDDVGEVDGDRLEELGLHALPVLQPQRHLARQHRQQQPLHAPRQQLQLRGPLLHLPHAHFSPFVP